MDNVLHRGGVISRHMVDSAVLPLPFAKKTLSVLLNLLPHTLKLNDRTLLLQFMVLEGRAETIREAGDPFAVRRGIRIQIRRNFIVEDTLAANQSAKCELVLLTLQLLRCSDIVETTYSHHVYQWGRDAGRWHWRRWNIQRIPGNVSCMFCIVCCCRFSLPKNFFLRILDCSVSYPVNPHSAVTWLIFFPEDRSLVPDKRAKSLHGPAVASLYRLAGTVIGKVGTTHSLWGNLYQALYEGVILEAVLNRTFINLVQNRQTQHVGQKGPTASSYCFSAGGFGVSRWGVLQASPSSARNGTLQRILCNAMKCPDRCPRPSIDILCHCRHRARSLSGLSKRCARRCSNK